MTRLALVVALLASIAPPVRADAPAAASESERAPAATTSVPPSTETAAAPSELGAPMPTAPPGGGRTVRWKRNRRRVTHNALLLFPYAFVGRGFTLAYERAFADARFALMARASFEAPASADYVSRAVGVGAEGRFYFLGRGPFTRYVAKAPVGPYVGFRLQVTTTWLKESQGGDTVGTSERLAMEPSFGCRFPIAGIVEITPSIGLLLYTDIVEGVASALRPTASFGLSVGVLFERRRRAPRAP